jgi:hypothetical protein
MRSAKSPHRTQANFRVYSAGVVLLRPSLPQFPVNHRLLGKHKLDPLVLPPLQCPQSPLLYKCIGVPRFSRISSYFHDRPAFHDVMHVLRKVVREVVRHSKHGILISAVSSAVKVICAESALLVALESWSAMSERQHGTFVELPV